MDHLSALFGHCLPPSIRLVMEIGSMCIEIPPPSAESFKVKRDAQDDAFSSIQSRVSTLARVVNGITLYNGLIAGTIPINEVISELMAMGSLKLQDLKTFDYKKIEEFLNEWKAVKFEDPINSILKEVVNLNKVQYMYVESQKLYNLPNETTIKTLDHLKTPEINVFATKSLVEKEDIDSAMKLIGDHGIIKILKKMQAFTDFVKLIETYETFKFEAIKSATPEQFSQLNSTLETLIEVIKKYKEPLDSMKLMILTQPTHRRYTTGFPNGYREFYSLKRDIDDPWLKELIGEQKELRNLIPLINLFVPMNSLDRKLIRRDPLRNAIREMSRIGTFSSKSIALPLETLRTQMPNETTSQLSEWKKISDNLEELTYKVNIVNLMQEITNATVEESIKKEMITILLEEFKKGQNIETLADSKQYVFIAEFSKEVSKYSYFFSFDLSELKFTDDKGSVAQLAVNVDNILTNFEKAMSDMKIAVTRLFALEFKMEKLKKNKALEDLNNLDELQKQLGDYSSLIHLIELVFLYEEELKRFLINGNSVSKLGRFDYSFDKRMVPKVVKLMGDVREKKKGMKKANTLEELDTVLKRLYGLEGVDLKMTSQNEMIDDKMAWIVHPKTGKMLKSFKRLVGILSQPDFTFTAYANGSTSLAKIREIFGNNTNEAEVTPIEEEPLVAQPKIQYVGLSEKKRPEQKSTMFSTTALIVYALLIAFIGLHIFLWFFPLKAFGWMPEAYEKVCGKIGLTREPKGYWSISDDESEISQNSIEKEPVIEQQPDSMSFRYLSSEKDPHRRNDDCARMYEQNLSEYEEDEQPQGKK
uniref:WSN domain-containing protein n=1 Tax=Caenorhabditis tropicalis TaxID=1561998 RepID=A0A1I7UPF6_9PELO